MRVIAGTIRGCRLQTLEGEQVRPTIDRVKEGMFNVLQFSLPGATVLDLFAGSGQLGIEALSRGAMHCTLVDRSREAVKVVRDNLQKTGLEGSAKVVHGDSLTYLDGSSDVWDVVLLDPPYDSTLLYKALHSLDTGRRVREWVMCEHHKDFRMPDRVGGLVLQKEYRYGKVALSLYKPVEE